MEQQCVVVGEALTPAGCSPETRGHCAPQVIVHEVPGQEIEVEVFDKDPDKDDFLGR